MGKTRRKARPRYYRSVRGNKQAMIEKESEGGIRTKAIPPDSWDEVAAQHECRMASRAATHMMNKGWDREKIIHHLVNKFGLSYADAREELPFDMMRNDDWTDKPK